MCWRRRERNPWPVLTNQIHRNYLFILEPNYFCFCDKSICPLLIGLKYKSISFILVRFGFFSGIFLSTYSELIYVKLKKCVSYTAALDPALHDLPRTEGKRENKFFWTKEILSKAKKLAEWFFFLTQQHKQSIIITTIIELQSYRTEGRWFITNNYHLQTSIRSMKNPHFCCISSVHEVTNRSERYSFFTVLW